MERERKREKGKKSELCYDHTYDNNLIRVLKFWNEELGIEQYREIDDNVRDTWKLVINRNSVDIMNTKLGEGMVKEEEDRGEGCEHGWAEIEFSRHGESRVDDSRQ